MKKIINIFLTLYFFFFLIASCSVKKKITQKEKIRYQIDTIYLKDSVFTNKVKLVYLPTINTEVISNPCDSAGNLKVIEKIIRIPFGKVEIRSEGNQLIAKVNTDSINSVYQTQYKERNEKQLHEIYELQKENSLLKITPFSWWMIGCIVSLVVNVFLFFLYVKNKIL